MPLEIKTSWIWPFLTFFFKDAVQHGGMRLLGMEYCDLSGQKKNYATYRAKKYHATSQAKKNQATSAHKKSEKSGQSG